MFLNPSHTLGDEPSGESIFEYADGVSLDELMELETVIAEIREMHGLGEQLISERIDNPEPPYTPEYLLLLEGALETQAENDALN